MPKGPIKETKKDGGGDEPRGRGGKNGKQKRERETGGGGRG